MNDFSRDQMVKRSTVFICQFQVWYAAVTQSFFSLSVGFGAIINYSSYNRFEHNVYRDALIISVVDTFTSLLAGFTIFSILGNLANELGVPVSEVIESGVGLAFISYPTALGKFSYVPQVCRMSIANPIFPTHYTLQWFFFLFNTPSFFGITQKLSNSKFKKSLLGRAYLGTRTCTQ